MSIFYGPVVAFLLDDQFQIRPLKKMSKSWHNAGKITKCSSGRPKHSQVLNRKISFCQWSLERNKMVPAPRGKV